MFGKEITIMLYEIDQFNLDIANIKKDLEIEDIVVTEEQVATLKQYINQEISFQDIVSRIQNSLA